MALASWSSTATKVRLNYEGKNYFVNVFKLYFSCSATTIFNHQILTSSAVRSAKTTTVTKRFGTVYVLLQLCMRNLRAVFFHVGLLWLLSIV